MPAVLRDAVCALCGPSMVEAVRRITGLEHASALQADPHCHGGGLHSHGTGDKLDLHLDYSLHPISGLERRFNLIVYLVPEPWPSSYGGALELRGAAQQSASEGVEAGELSASVLPAFNRAVLFSTTAPSFHGFPAPLCCPADARRKCAALPALARALGVLILLGVEDPPPLVRAPACAAPVHALPCRAVPDTLPAARAPIWQLGCALLPHTAATRCPQALQSAVRADTG